MCYHYYNEELYMKTRMEKYYDEEGNSLALKNSRANKNENLYDSLETDELNNLNITDNYAIIGDNDDVIDIKKVKEMVDSRYKTPQKRKTFNFDMETEEELPSLEDTKEYDLNAILSKARENKVVDYEKERLKKVRDTQFDILSNLNLDKEKDQTLTDEIEPFNSSDDSSTEINPLDILEDLKGNDNTVTIKGMTEEVKKLEEEQTLPKKEKPVTEKINVEQSEKEEDTTKIDKSFYTTQTSFNSSDYDDFNDLKEDVKVNQILIKIIIFIIIIAIIAGGILLANKFLDLGLF